MAIRDLFGEIRYEVAKISLLNSVIDSTLFFLVMNLLFSLFSIKIIYALVLTLPFFLYRYYAYSKKIDLNKVEQRNPRLKEMLRTARDNEDRENLMVRGLFSDVKEKVRDVSSGSFFDMRFVLYKIGVIFVISFLLVGLAFFNVNVNKFENPFAEEIGALEDWAGGFKKNDSKKPEVDVGDDSLYGDVKLAELEDKKLGVDIKSSLNEVNFNEVEDPASDGEKGEEMFPEDVGGTAAGACKDCNLKDVQELKAAGEYCKLVDKC